MEFKSEVLQSAINKNNDQHNLLASNITTPPPEHLSVISENENVIELRNQIAILSRLLSSEIHLRFIGYYFKISFTKQSDSLFHFLMV